MRYLSTFRDEYGTPRAWAFGPTAEAASTEAGSMIARYVADCRASSHPVDQARAAQVYTETVTCVPSS